MRGRRAVAAVVVIVFAAFAYLVWPTPYRYLPSPHAGIYAVRLHRLTGEADILTSAGWRPAQRRAGDAADPFGLFADSTR